MNKLIVLLVVLGVVLAGCTGSQPAASGLGGTAATKEPIRIGAVLAMSDELASWGKNAVAGAQMAMDEINAAGGVNGRMLEMIVEDDKCSSKGATAISKLINIDRVDAIIGPICSASGGPALPIAQKAGVPTAVITASAPHLTAVGGFIYRVCPSDAMHGKFIAELISGTLGKKKAAVIYVENDWGVGLTDVFRESFAGLGGEIVYEAGVTADERDFRTQITKAIASGADVLFAPLYVNGGLVAVKQAKELGIGIPIVGGDTFNGEEFTSKPDADGIIFSVAKIAQPEEFVSRLKSRPVNESLEVAIPAPLAYDAVYVLAEAMKRAGSADKEAVKEALKRTKRYAVSNPVIEFDAQGDLKEGTIEARIIREGKSFPYGG